MSVGFVAIETALADCFGRPRIANWIRNKYERKDWAPRNKLSPSELLAQADAIDLFSNRSVILSDPVLSILIYRIQL